MKNVTVIGAGLAGCEAAWQLARQGVSVTLIEMISVIAVLGVVMAATAGFMITGAKMSVKVSDGATGNLREQTAVELINEKLMECTTIECVHEFDLDIPLENPTIAIIDGKYLKTNFENLADPTVTYNGVELCKGTIIFIQDDMDDNIIRYVLNDVEHVVHLRAAQTSEEQIAENEGDNP